MGEDFVKRRNDRFVRHREACFAAQSSPDLFSAVPPEAVVTVLATAIAEVQECRELWTPNVNAPGPIDFYDGDIAVVRVEGADADHLRARDDDAPMVAQVLQVDREHGLVELKVTSTS
ncbi:MAG: hypothetical protein IT379_11790 [Deltaproteobacteria bacterium]|nr:hypothetical protein [Deltaproteobacteria bacterium]